MKNIAIIAGVAVLVVGVAIWRSGPRYEETADSGRASNGQTASPPASDESRLTDATDTNEALAPPADEETAQASAAQTDDAKVIVYYLHRTRRCGGCQTAERYTRQALDENFADELASGRLAFQSVDIQSRDNRDLVTSLGPGGSLGLTLMRVQDGQPPEYKSLVSIWGYLRSYEDFAQHLSEEITQMFGGG